MDTPGFSRGEETLASPVVKDGKTPYNGRMKLAAPTATAPTMAEQKAVHCSWPRWGGSTRPRRSRRVAFEAKVFSQPSIHKRCYAEDREKFGLSAQMAVRAIGKAVEAFRRDKTACPTFKPRRRLVTYDERILGVQGTRQGEPLDASTGRMLLPLSYGEYQGRALVRPAQGAGRSRLQEWQVLPVRHGGPSREGAD